MTTQIARVNTIAEMRSAKSVLSMIDSAGVAREQFESMIQEVAIQCVFHAHIHGNVELSKQALEKMKNKGKSGVRYKALENYLLFFGAMRIVDKEWKLDKKRRDVNLFNDAVKIQQILSTSWVSFKHTDVEVETTVKLEIMTKAAIRVNKGIDKGLKLEGNIADINSLMTELNKMKEILEAQEAAALLV